MADTIQPSTPGSASVTPKKKKKFLPFLKRKSSPKDIPDHIFDDDQNDLKKRQEKNNEDDDGLDLFKRSKDYFSRAIQEQEERLKTKSEEEQRRRSQAAEEKRKSTSLDLADGEESAKRRKLSRVEPSDDWLGHELYGDPTPRQTSPPKPRSPSPHTTRTTSPLSRPRHPRDSPPPIRSDILPTPSRPTKSATEHSNIPTNPITLGDDSDEAPPTRIGSNEVGANGSATRHKQSDDTAAIVLDDDDDDGDPFGPGAKESDEMNEDLKRFIERARQAREREKAAKAAAASASPATPADDSQTHAPGDTAADSSAVVGILLAPRLTQGPPIKPLMVMRGLTQSLRVVREMWLNHARRCGLELSPSEEDGIFLTWKGRKIYDSTTASSLGCRTDAAGQLVTSGERAEDGYFRTRMLLEVWTQQDYNDHLAAEERQRRVELGELDDDEEDTDGEGGGGSGGAILVEDEPVKLRVSIKEKDMDPVKTTVLADMPVSIIVSAYRKQRAVPPDKTIRLMYEGMWLNENDTVQEADIDDMCTIEVYVR